MWKSANPVAESDRALLIRSAAGLAAVGASLTLGLQELRGRWVSAFVRSNALPMRQRDQLLLAALIGVLAGLGLAAALVVRARAGGDATAAGRVSRAARLVAPLALLGFTPALMRPDAWPDTLTLTLVLMAFVLGLEPLFRLHFGAYRPPDRAAAAADRDPAAARPARWRAQLDALAARLPPWLRRHGPALAVAAAALGYAIYMSFYVVRSHYRFNTYTWDLGQIDNLFYNMLHGHPFRSTPLIRDGSWTALRNHAEVVTLFLLPFYAIHPAAETLLVMQAVLLGLGGVFLYRFAARRLPRWTAVLLTVAYYFYAPMHGPQFFDIHLQPIAAAFVLAAIDCFDARRMRLFVVFFILAITCREDISVGLAVFGLFLILTGHRMRAGAVILSVSLVYFVALRFVIMPAIGTWGFAEHYRQLMPSDGPRSFGGIIKTIVSNPLYTFTTLLTAEKLRYALQILLPLAFLPLRRPHLAMSVLPGAYFTILTTQYGPTTDIAYQYPMYFVPYIFPAAALALAEMTARPDGLARRRAAVAVLVVATVLTTAHWGAIPPRSNFHTVYGNHVEFDPPTPEQIQRRRDLHELMAMVPRDAIVATTDRELPHISNRTDCWNLSVGYQGADYLLHTKINPTSAETEQVEAAERAGYAKIAERPAMILYKRPGAR